MVKFDFGKKKKKKKKKNSHFNKDIFKTTIIVSTEGKEIMMY